MQADIIIFDLDGTLLDSLPDITGAVNCARRSRGLRPIECDLVGPHIGAGLGRLLQMCVPEVRSDEIADLRPVFMEYYARNLLTESAPFPGVEAVLNSLPRKALVSNKPRRFGTAILDALNWQFDGVIYGDDGFGRKPDPRPLKTMLGRFGIAPSKAVYVGDTAIDSIAAREAEMQFRLVPWSNHEIVHGIRLDALEELSAMASDPKQGTSV